MTDSVASTTKSRGESHRIYWQQWPSAVNANKNRTKISSRRDLITSSAAIRISPEGARAKDVTQLLCETLNLKSNKEDEKRASSPRQESWDRVQDIWEKDSLVLVGTLYSLPPKHVRFEHERLDNNSANNFQKTIASRHDPPFHVIKTLSGADNPIQIRNEMIKHLESILRQSAAATPPSGRSQSVSPKLQWYFVPGINHPSSPIPSHIDLDGYSTAMEDDDNDYDEEITPQGSNVEEEEDHQDSEHDLEGDELLYNLSLSLQEKNQLEETDGSKKEMNPVPSKTISEKERIFKKERNLFFELSMCQSSLQQDCISGYLLKQSMTDPHVWKRMHCVLTDEHLWFISRIYTKLDEESTQTNQPQQFYSYAKHRRLGLTRALLIQPSADKPKTPLFRTPFAFEIIDATGSAHRFRASNPENYKRWVGALQSRIVQAYENSLLEHAELIVRDETEARNKRFQSIVVEPLWENRQIFQELESEGDNTRYTVLDDPTMQILNFGIEVNRYREHCRHIEAILPAKYPVLAMTDSTPELRINNGNQNDSGQSDTASVGKSSVSSGAFRLDTRMQALIKSAWDEAVRLGSFATKLAVTLQCTNNSSSSKSTAKMPSSLETICQHLEYVITGNFRTNGSKSPQNNNRGRPDNTRQYPPPVDLFDQLLVELQHAASIVSAKTRKNGTNSKPSTTKDTSKSPPRRRVIQAGKTNGGSHS